MYGYPGLGEGCRTLTPLVTVFPSTQNLSSRGDFLSLGRSSPWVPLRALIFFCAPILCSRHTDLSLGPAFLVSLFLPSGGLEVPSILFQPLSPQKESGLAPSGSSGFPLPYVPYLPS